MTPILWGAASSGTSPRSFAVRAVLSLSMICVVGHADETPFTSESISIAGGVEYGGGEPASPYRMGFQGRAGVTLDNGLYAGGVTDYFLGETATIELYEDTRQVWQWVAELGYDYGVTSNVVLRPKLGLGFGIWEFKRETIGTIQSSSDNGSDLLYTIGAQALYDLSRLQIACEVRYNSLGGDQGSDTFVVGATLGARLQDLVGD